MFVYCLEVLRKYSVCVEHLLSVTWTSRKISWVIDTLLQLSASFIGTQGGFWREFYRSVSCLGHLGSLLTYMMPNRIHPVQCLLTGFRNQVVSEQHNCSVTYGRTLWQDYYFTTQPLKFLVILLCVQEVPRSYLSLASLPWPRCSGSFISLTVLVLYLKKCDMPSSSFRIRDP